MKHRFIHGWVAQQQKAYHQRTRGIMAHEERKELEAEAIKAMAEIERKAAEKAWDEGFAHSVRTVFHDRMPRLEDNPYRKGVQS